MKFIALAQDSFKLYFLFGKTLSFVLQPQVANMASPAPAHDGQLPQYGKCHLLDLPPELRLHIYEYVYNAEVIITLAAGLYGFRWLRQQHESRMENLTGLIQSCKTSYREATPLLHKQLKLHIAILPHGAVYASHIDEVDRFIAHLRLSPNSYPLKQIQRVLISIERPEREGMSVTSVLRPFEAIAAALHEDSSVNSVHCVIDYVPSGHSKKTFDALQDGCTEAIARMESNGSCTVERLLLWRTLEEAVKKAGSKTSGRETCAWASLRAKEGEIFVESSVLW